MSVLKYDKVILIKELGEKMKKVGETFEIASVLDDAFLIRDSRTKVALGVIGFEDFDKYFINEENFKGWTKWSPLVGFDGQSDAFYRSNGKKTQVKFLTDKVRGECCCCKDDDFNLSFGIQLAYLRCLNKARIKQRIELEEKLNMVEHEIAENETIIKKMVNSLS